MEKLGTEMHPDGPNVPGRLCWERYIIACGTGRQLCPAGDGSMQAQCSLYPVQAG